MKVKLISYKTVRWVPQTNYLVDDLFCGTSRCIVQMSKNASNKNSIDV